MTNLDSVLKSRHHFADKGPSSRSYVFSSSHVRMWEAYIKKAEGQRTDVFELWCWRRLLRVPWTARRSNQFSLKEISPGISLEGMMLKLKLQYFGHLMQRVDSLEKTLMLGGIGGRRRRGRQRMRWLDGITDSMDSRECGWTLGVGDGQGGLACCNSWGRKESDTTERLNWTELEEFGENQKERGDASLYIPPTFQNPPRWNPSWPSNAHATRKDPESEQLARNNPETNLNTIKPEPASHAAQWLAGLQVLRGSLTLLLSSRVPLPNKVSCFVSTCLLGQFIFKC